MKRFCLVLVVIVLYLETAAAQNATVIRNVNLRQDPSTNNAPITKLTQGAHVQLLEPDPVSGYFRVKIPTGETGFVWSRNVQVQEGAEHTPTIVPGTGAPTPLLAKGHPVDWWFVFKFNAASFPGCGGTAPRSCPFGGTVQNYRAFSQQFIYASSDARTLKEGATCLGESTDDPVGATFDQVYNSNFFYVIWNDQFYDDPDIEGCGESCGAPWGHSKGMLAWNETGDGFVLQVTTPSWPAAGSKNFPRTTDGNTLGCVKDNNVQVSQHFFALRLNKDDLVKVLAALGNASVVTVPGNKQLVRNGGPADVQSLVTQLGSKSDSGTFIKTILSTGVELISKPSRLHVPPWQMVSSVMGGVSLRTATWWTTPKIYSTTSSTDFGCWDASLTRPGAVEIAMTGHWAGKEIGLTGGPGTNFNHAKFGVSTSGTAHYSVFGDMNQQGTASGENCSSSQNGRGGLFYVVKDENLAGSITDLIRGGSAPTAPPN